MATVRASDRGAIALTTLNDEGASGGLDRRLKDIRTGPDEVAGKAHIGIPDRFVSCYGTIDDIRLEIGLDPERIREAVGGLLRH